MFPLRSMARAVLLDFENLRALISGRGVLTCADFPYRLPYQRGTRVTRYQSRMKGVAISTRILSPLLITRIFCRDIPGSEFDY